MRDNLQKCYRVEGVNHLEKCKDIAERYAQMLKDNKVRNLLLIASNESGILSRCMDSSISTCREYHLHNHNCLYCPGRV